MRAAGPLALPALRAFYLFSTSLQGQACPPKDTMKCSNKLASLRTRPASYYCLLISPDKRGKYFQKSCFQKDVLKLCPRTNPHMWDCPIFVVRKPKIFRRELQSHKSFDSKEANPEGLYENSKKGFCLVSSLGWRTILFLEIVSSVPSCYQRWNNDIPSGIFLASSQHYQPRSRHESLISTINSLPKNPACVLVGEFHSPARKETLLRWLVRIETWIFEHTNLSAFLKCLLVPRTDNLTLEGANWGSGENCAWYLLLILRKVSFYKFLNLILCCSGIGWYEEPWLWAPYLFLLSCLWFSWLYLEGDLPTSKGAFPSKYCYLQVPIRPTVWIFHAERQKYRLSVSREQLLKSESQPFIPAFFNLSCMTRLTIYPG